MTFQHLLDGAEVLSRSGDPSVSGVEYDSRRVKPGCVFVAMRGESSDGNRFIDQAIQAGAVAVVTDSASETPREGVAWAVVPHGRRALARLSANFYKRPAERIAVTGITGTNGKSTTAFLVESILTAAGRKSALMGTIEYHVAGHVYPAPHTTPEALELARILNEALGLGATDAVMEVSSHALAQERVFGVPFDVAVFTNLTRDHLDFHHTMEEYAAAKRMLFAPPAAPAPRWAVLNRGDAASAAIVNEESRVIWYGLSEEAQLHVENVRTSLDGLGFDLCYEGARQPMESGLAGRINVLNILAASGAALSYGIDLPTIARGIAACGAVPGRFERIDCGQPFLVVVDYAHTDDALRSVIQTAREMSHLTKGGRVITLFGCGGDRDRSKRPLMGMAAGELSDFVVLTSDNPRSEDPLDIINDTLVGLRRFDTLHVAEPDRAKAIRIALKEAREGDVVLIAGKGHEPYQALKDRTIQFDDREKARDVLRSLYEKS